LYIPAIWKNDNIVPSGEEMLVGVAEDVKTTINSMLERIGNGEFKCTMCGKINTHRASMGRHIETHIEGISYPCSQCGKITKSSHALTKHISRNHRM
jgi:predicted RNA-binding Zn-ribbon protein involved in translation (DUF1610 family)